ncbi:DNA polymerase III subunit gamma/tau [Agrilutibacter solisilvae]|uniref:DNA polymerase III subunit gamma/tau n=1 Tax=Agrilutibacter solisilvae TaxID=2763317 RepID=A0A975ASF8_9GAMM|nr:DNA polymerase III subunit gamma/tau [Lysobacter solisilvae]QSX78263.1 DNA polymerase III subunit gamma/tau [Lysobacter solisilvae]
MSYLVLARKWRPKRFAELVGQEHVVRALTNALDSGRVHHAFLFTGTRGVGKTTIARIFAKSLNCEQGTSADPCGQCETCLAIDAGRYIDLLEIDAASNTGVDNVRELIENAQYMPSRGRYKVYLIDEVHMLSKAAFNALLKTLEEPPGHVKFLFATTDPEKLLVTVLSRCLQFNLKRLDEAQITGQITRILQAEGIAAESGAIAQLARAADGSLRDGLSLLDQAIGYTGASAGGGQLDNAGVAAMLGTVDRTRVDALLQALANGDGAALLAEVATLAEFSPDWGGVLDAFGAALHRIQVRQLVPEVPSEGEGVDVDGLAARVRPEVVQLWYQMALNGRRDLAYAPSPRAGFEMTVLRMLAFRPADGEGARAPAAATGSATGPGRTSPALAREAAAALLAPERGADRPVASRPPIDAGAGKDSPPWPAADVATPAKRPPLIAPSAMSSTPAPPAPTAPAPVAAIASAPVAPARFEAANEPAPFSNVPTPSMPAASTTASPGAAASTLVDADAWHALVASSGLRGPARILAEHSTFVGYDDGILRLSLPSDEEHLKSGALTRMMADALTPALGGCPQIRFEGVAQQGTSLRDRNERARDERQNAAETAFLNDPDVQRLMSQHGAKVVADSIRPFDEP